VAHLIGYVQAEHRKLSRSGFRGGDFVCAQRNVNNFGQYQDMTWNKPKNFISQILIFRGRLGLNKAMFKATRRCNEISANCVPNAEASLPSSPLV